MPINKRAEEIVKSYAEALRKKDVPVKLIILFGSQARGTSIPGSDIDVLVVTERLDKKIRDTIVDEAFEISMREDIPVIALPCDIQEFDSPSFKFDPFYRNVTQEGIIFHGP